MKRSTLAKKLIEARARSERLRLLHAEPQIADVRLAEEIRKICYAAWATEPTKARRAAAAIVALKSFNSHQEISAISDWVAGIASITRGRFEKSVELLESARTSLGSVGRAIGVAQTSVALLLSLAMLGRYDEAIAVGREALAVFIREGDHLAAGKIEMNLSNIVSRRSQHHEAERYCASALRHFVLAGEGAWQTMAENGLANTYMELNEFAKAERFFRSALDKARRLRMTVTEAEIEASLGNLALMRGDHSTALRSLEVSRQIYLGIGMPHQSAIAELEIADIYSSLNLQTEAIDIYRRLIIDLAKLKLRADEARARLGLGRTLLKAGVYSSAKRELNRASTLFEREGNSTGTLAAILLLAQCSIAAHDHKSATAILTLAKELIELDEDPRGRVKLELTAGFAALEGGDTQTALDRFRHTVRLAEKCQDMESVWAAHTHRGRAFSVQGRHGDAKRSFRKAISTAEQIHRGWFAGEEFSAFFLGSRLDAHTELGREYLREGQVARAFAVFESGRARSLRIKEGKSGRSVSRSLELRAAAARAELNILYRKADVTLPDERAALYSKIDHAERIVTDVNRQIAGLSIPKTGRKKNKLGISMRGLKSRLARDNGTLVEYVILDGSIDAFIITGKFVKHVSSIATSAGIGEMVENLHFSLDTSRYTTDALEKFARQIKAKTDLRLAELYDALIRPIERYIKGDSLIIVPSGPIHYVPFAALIDGGKYLVERFEIRSSPSAEVWLRLGARRRKKLRRQLLIGYADERIPLVEDEIESVTNIFPTAKVFSGKTASFSSLMDNLEGQDLIHIACHAEFREDNPMFSALHLADGWVTVRDLASKHIAADLVILSGCETGVSKLFPGDEILGLARGFLSAGARALIVSHWTVNDRATSRMMPSIYEALNSGASAASALRTAQLSMIARGENPFLWAPFVYIGA